MKDISIRATIESDLEEIFRIRTDPDVAAFQYPLAANDSLETWREQLSGDNVVEGIATRHSTIFKGSQVVGHISQFHYEVAEVKIACCGWNLAPAEWGNGFMRLALTKQFDVFFNEDQIHHVFADCFKGNTRCLRLIHRLGFVPQEISFMERVYTAWFTKRLRWTKRFRLDRDVWQQAQSGESK